MRNLVALVIFVLFLNYGCIHSKKSTVHYSNLEFYKTHSGTWYGNLKIFKEDTIVSTLPMQFSIQPTDTLNRYKWQIKYDTQASRNYRLDLLDATKGQFQIDEKNGIILPANLNNGVLNSYFSVMKSTLLISYDFRNEDKIIFTVNAFGTKPIQYTGQSNSAIDSIGIYPFFGYQEAVLVKEN